ncbi:unnamed protein product, partial [Dicrocoelium dendriticum]
HPVCTRLFQYPTRNEGPSADRLSNDRHELLPSCNRLLATSTACAPKSRDPNCIAILTAKATVWNRAVKASTDASCNTPRTQKPSPLIAPELFSTVYPRPISTQTSHTTSRNLATHPSHQSTPLLPLKFGSRRQPQLSTRRVVQIGYDVKWRRFALGTSKSHRTAVCLARRFLHAHHPGDCPPSFSSRRQPENRSSSSLSVLHPTSVKSEPT